MADTARAFYLGLYFDVWDDPLVAKLRATWKVALVSMLIRAVKSEEPGVILLPPAALAVALNMREATCEEMLDELESRRLIGFRKGDNAIIIAHRLLPQLINGADIGEHTPPRQKSPQQRAAATERQRRSRARRKPSEPKAEARAEARAEEEEEPAAGTETLLGTFFADCPLVEETPQAQPEADEESVTTVSVTPVTATTVTANGQPNIVKEDYNTVPGPRDIECDTSKDKCEAVSDFLLIDCQLNPDDVKTAVDWLPSLDEAQAYAFWAGEVRKHKPKPGGTLGGLLASLLRERKPIPPEFRSAYQQAQQEQARQQKAAEKARRAQEVAQAQADAYQTRLFSLQMFLQELPSEERSRFEAGALQRLRQTNRLAAEALVKNPKDTRFVSVLEIAQLAEKDAWPQLSPVSPGAPPPAPAS